MPKRNATKATKISRAGEYPRALVGYVPVSSFTLTPKDALAWLSKAGRWHDFISLASLHANAEEREHLADFTYWLGNLVEAAARAIRTQANVDLESDLDIRTNRGDPAGATRGLALLLRAAMRGVEEKPEDVEVDFLFASSAAREIADAIVGTAEARREEREQHRRCLGDASAAREAA